MAGSGGHIEGSIAAGAGELGQIRSLEGSGSHLLQLAVVELSIVALHGQPQGAALGQEIRLRWKGKKLLKMAE